MSKRKTRFPKALSKTEVLEFFQTVDQTLSALDQNSKPKMEITVLGGVAVITLDIRNECTRNIDLLPTTDSNDFLEFCKIHLRKFLEEQEIDIEIVTITSTIDTNECEKKLIFNGEKFNVSAVSDRDLLKSKLERYYKQDPEDVRILLNKLKISSKEYLNICKEMDSYFTGNHRNLILNLEEAAENFYSQEEFKAIYSSLENMLQEYPLV